MPARGEEAVQQVDPPILAGCANVGAAPRRSAAACLCTKSMLPHHTNATAGSRLPRLKAKMPAAQGSRNKDLGAALGAMLPPPAGGKCAAAATPTATCSLTCQRLRGAAKGKGEAIDQEGCRGLCEGCQPQQGVRAAVRKQTGGGAPQLTGDGSHTALQQRCCQGKARQAQGPRVGDAGASHPA